MGNERRWLMGPAVLTAAFGVRRMFVRFERRQSGAGGLGK